MQAVSTWEKNVPWRTVENAGVQLCSEPIDESLRRWQFADSRPEKHTLEDSRERMCCRLLCTY